MLSALQCGRRPQLWIAKSTATTARLSTWRAPEVISSLDFHSLLLELSKLIRNIYSARSIYLQQEFFHQNRLWLSTIAVSSMKCLISFLLLVATAIATPNNGWGHDHSRGHRCLSDQSANNIVSRWIALHASDPTTPTYRQIADQTLTDDVTVEDETVSFFFFPANPTGPYTTNKTSLIGLLTNAFQTSVNTVPSITLEIPLRHDCDSITFRWIISATINKVVPGR